MLSLATGLAVSVAANAAVPFLPTEGEPVPGELSAIVAAWPAVAPALAAEQLMRIRATREHAPEVQSEPAEAAPETPLDEQPSKIPAEAVRSDPVPAEAEPLPETNAEAQHSPLVPEPTAPDPVPETAGTELTLDVPETETGDPREAARELVRSGQVISGKALGEQFGRSDSWGRAQIRAVKHERSALLTLGQ